MKQIILDTNAVRYFYQIECCNGEGVRDKVMKKYYFDKQKYVQFLRTVSSISIPATTKFELFFQAYRKGEPDLLVKPYSVKLTIVLHPVFSAIIPAGN